MKCLLAALVTLAALLSAACAAPKPPPLPARAAQVRIRVLTEDLDELAHARCIYKGVFTLAGEDMALRTAATNDANLVEPLFFQVHESNGAQSKGPYTCALFQCREFPPELDR